MKSQLLRISPRRFFNLFLTVLIFIFTVKAILKRPDLIKGNKNEDDVIEGITDPDQIECSVQYGCRAV